MGILFNDPQGTGGSLEHSGSLTGGMFDYNANYTVARWYYPEQIPSSVGDNRCVMFLGTRDGQNGDFIDVRGQFPGKLYHRVEIGSSNAGEVTGSTVLQSGSWYHVTFVRNGTSCSIYLNGVLDAELDGITIGSRTAPSDVARFGSTPDGFSFDYGRIAYLRIWTSSLTPSEIQAEVYASTAQKTSTLWDQWVLPDTNSLSGSTNTYPLTIVGSVANTTDPPLYSFDQYAFRFRNDDGDEITATWYAAENTNATAPTGSNIRLRIGMNASADPPSQRYRLEWKRSTESSTAWRTAVTASLGVTESYSNTGTWVCPTDVTAIKVECWGGGGAGSRCTSNASGRGGGGGGGYARRNTLAVTPGNTYNFTIGAGGTGSATPTNGGITIFTGDAGVICAASGGFSAAVNVITPGLGGGSGSVGDFIQYGGNGGSGSGTFSGGGGGSAGDLTSGGTATLSGSGAAGTLGGAAGAVGRNNSANSVGNNGSAPGAGGSGAFRVSATSNNGGFGGTGQILIKYAPSRPVLVATSANIASGSVGTAPQLTPPSGKTTTNYTSGSVQDDHTRTAVIDVGNNGYSEAEWVLQPITGIAAVGDILQFRLATEQGVAFATYTNAPQLTIGTPSAPIGDPPIKGQLYPRWNRYVTQHTYIGQLWPR